MIHYTCDRCKKELDAEQDLRFIVRIEMEAAMNRAEELADDQDHLMELDEILEQVDGIQNDCLSDAIYQKRRYDLCADCQRQFVKNPLGREVNVSLGFSKN